MPLHKTRLQWAISCMATGYTSSNLFQFVLHSISFNKEELDFYLEAFLLILKIYVKIEWMMCSQIQIDHGWLDFFELVEYWKNKNWLDKLKRLNIIKYISESRKGMMLSFLSVVVSHSWVCRISNLNKFFAFFKVHKHLTHSWKP